MIRVFIGFDERESIAYSVLADSIMNEWGISDEAGFF